jgi:peptidase E
MLAVWQDWGLPEILREAWEKGVVLTGISAGAICWFEAGVTDSWEQKLFPLECLGFLPGGCCPHYDAEADRRPALHELLTKENFPPTLALEDDVAAHFQGKQLLRVVSSRPAAGAFRAEFKGNRIVESALPIEHLQTV